MPTKLLFIGGGKMGGAMLKGLLAQGHEAKNLTVVDPACPSFGEIRVLASMDAYVGPTPAAVILAIKPQIMANVLPMLSERIKDSLILSIAAGKSLRFFQDIFGPHTRLVRAMPNLPAAIGAGMTGWIGSSSLHAEDRALTQAILSATGQAHEMKSEDQIDAWTAIAGSGPAYLFHFLECLSTAAQNLGFDPDLSHALSKQTVLGAAQLADQSPESFATLRESVTSPGGTTAAGLEVLMRQLQGLLNQTCQNAYERAVELGRSTGS